LGPAGTTRPTDEGSCKPPSKSRRTKAGTSGPSGDPDDREQFLRKQARLRKRIVPGTVPSRPQKNGRPANSQRRSEPQQGQADRGPITVKEATVLRNRRRGGIRRPRGKNQVTLKFRLAGPESEIHAGGSLRPKNRELAGGKGVPWSRFRGFRLIRPCEIKLGWGSVRREAGETEKGLIQTSDERSA